MCTNTNRSTNRREYDGRTTDDCDNDDENDDEDEDEDENEDEDEDACSLTTLARGTKEFDVIIKVVLLIS
ncbi:hypothetical protein M0802_006143 [Mischocyttarus mexicanus]|nr:hypothetical protein M0802_006143 [Mischocyttarus mexicanus]